jgi:hypothetical protein
VFFVKTEEQALHIVKMLNLTAGIEDLNDSPYAYELDNSTKDSSI